MSKYVYRERNYKFKVTNRWLNKLTYWDISYQLFIMDYKINNWKVEDLVTIETEEITICETCK